MEERVVLRNRDDASATGDHKARTRGSLCKKGALLLPEGLLAVFRDRFCGRSAIFHLVGIVHIDEGAVEHVR